MLLREVDLQGKKILACDPGITTGFMVLQDNRYTPWQINCRELKVPWQFLLDINPDALVYEDFKHRPGLMKAELYSKEVIGVLRLYSELRNIPILFTCLPAEAKKFWEDDKIKRLSLWSPGTKYEHAMDALRVLLTYQMKHHPVWFADIVTKLKTD